MKLSWIGILMPLVWLFCGMFLLSANEEPIDPENSYAFGIIAVTALLGALGFIAALYDIRRKNFEQYYCVPWISAMLNFPAFIVFFGVLLALVTGAFA